MSFDDPKTDAQDSALLDLRRRLDAAEEDARLAREELAQAKVALAAFCTPKALAAVNPAGLTPLGQAMVDADLPRVRLLAPLSDLSMKDAKGNTPMMRAAMLAGQNGVDCARILLDCAPNPVDFILCDYRPETESALSFAAVNNAQVLRLFIEAIPKERLLSPVWEGRPLLATELLFEAVENGNAEAVAVLAPWADVDCIAHRERTFRCSPLQRAAENGHAHCVQALLKAGATVRHQRLHEDKREEEHPLAAALRGQSADCVRLLASLSDLRTRMSSKQVDGHSFATWGAKTSSPEAMAALLEHCDGPILLLDHWDEKSGEREERDAFDSVPWSSENKYRDEMKDLLLCAFMQAKVEQPLGGHHSHHSFSYHLKEMRSARGGRQAYPRAAALWEAQQIQAAMAETQDEGLDGEGPREANHHRPASRL